ncbi:MAG TPA: GIY-YIG nuclease family protein [Ruminococcaceae bacterium]|nr:GIY-YIG nuclease family protein [Oscillospiraceae bacterium]
MYYTYIIRCTDDSLYTGITTDVKRRFEEHLSQNEKSAKYTRTHKAIKIEAVWQSKDRISASRLEYQIKRLTKVQKEELIKNNDFNVFKDKIKSDDYKVKSVS